MKIFVDKIPDEGLSLDFEEGTELFPVLKEIEKTDECKISDPVRTHLKVRKITGMIEVKGRVEMSARFSCRRCLTEFELPLKRRFQLFYTDKLPEVEETDTEDGVELTAEDMGLILYKVKEIYLREAIQEQLVMAFPAWPLCREDCKGLCLKCGADLNQGDCGCDRTPGDDRFAVLKNLKLK